MRKQIAHIAALAVFLLLPCSCKSAPRVEPAPSIEELRARLADDPKDCRLNEQLGSAYQQQQMYPESIEHFEASLTQCPGDPFVRFKLGQSIFLIGMCKQGERIMREAVYTAKRQGDAAASKSLALELTAWLESREDMPVECAESD